MPTARIWVLDTSAIFAFKQGEPGTLMVERVLREAAKGLSRVFVCFISLMEYFYVVYQQQGESEARRAYLQLRQLPIQVIDSDEELGLVAGEIKAVAKLSLADAWIAASAQRLGATLMHKDPEFENLRNQISLLALPYRN